MSNHQKEVTLCKSMANLGVGIKPEFAKHVLNVLHESGATAPSADQMTEFAMAQVLHENMHRIGSGCLPANMATRHNETLNGKFVLQIDQIVNVAQPHEQRGGESGKRMLKVLLSDGVQQVCAFEYGRSDARERTCLNVNTPAGIKVRIQNPEIRHGMILLTPENIILLGGETEYIDSSKMMTQGRAKQGELQSEAPSLPNTTEPQEVRQGNSGVMSPMPPPRNNRRNDIIRSPDDDMANPSPNKRGRKAETSSERPMDIRTGPKQQTFASVVQWMGTVGDNFWASGAKFQVDCRVDNIVDFYYKGDHYILNIILKDNDGGRIKTIVAPRIIEKFLGVPTKEANNRKAWDKDTKKHFRNKLKEMQAHFTELKGRVTLGINVMRLALPNDPDPAKFTAEKWS